MVGADRDVLLKFTRVCVNFKNLKELHERKKNLQEKKKGSEDSVAREEGRNECQVLIKRYFHLQKDWGEQLRSYRTLNNR